MDHQSRSDALKEADRLAEHRVQSLTEPFRTYAKHLFIEGYMARYSEVNG